MAHGILENSRLLIVEDEYLIADEIRAAFERAGAIVLGPTCTLSDTLDLIAAEPRIDGAILDIRLHGMRVFPAADKLVARRVPFLFLSGLDPATTPERFAGIAHFQKPADIQRIQSAIADMLRAEGVQPKSASAEVPESG